jgi:hypothetical protein
MIPDWHRRQNLLAVFGRRLGSNLSGTSIILAKVSRGFSQKFQAHAWLFHIFKGTINISNTIIINIKIIIIFIT